MKLKLDVGRPQAPKPTLPAATAAPTPSDPTKFQMAPDDAGKKHQHQMIIDVD